MIKKLAAVAVLPAGLIVMGAAFAYLDQSTAYHSPYAGGIAATPPA